MQNRHDMFFYIDINRVIRINNSAIFTKIDIICPVYHNIEDNKCKMLMTDTRAMIHISHLVNYVVIVIHAIHFSQCLLCR